MVKLLGKVKPLPTGRKRRAEEQGMGVVKREKVESGGYEMPQQTVQVQHVKTQQTVSRSASSTPQLSNTTIKQQGKEKEVQSKPQPQQLQQPLQDKKKNAAPLTMLSIMTKYQLKSHVHSLHPMQCLSVSTINQVCKGIIKRLREDENSWIFNTPVDCEAW